MKKIKNCIKCKQEKNVAEFHKDKNKRFGVKDICKECYKLKYAHSCIGCGIIITGEKSLRCKSCARKHFSDIKGRKTYCCMDCGNFISRPTSLHGGGRCLECAGTVRRGKKIKRNFTGKNNPNWKDGRTKKQYFCDCGNKISLDNAIYGSKTCLSCRSLKNWKQGVYNKRNFKNIKNPNYIHGLSKNKYPNIFKFIKIIIRKRDNFTCQCCGMKEKKSLKKFGEVLHVHHIDYNKEDCSENNLITTCKICNIKANFNRDYWYAFYTHIMKEIIYGK